MSCTTGCGATAEDRAELAALEQTRFKDLRLRREIGEFLTYEEEDILWNTTEKQLEVLLAKRPTDMTAEEWAEMIAAQDRITDLRRRLIRTAVQGD